MTDLAKLVVRLEAETGRYQAELQRAKGKLAGFRKDSNAEIKKLAAQIGTLTVGAATGLGALTQRAIGVADSYSKMAQQVGIATESLQGLAFAAKLNGVELQVLRPGLNLFNKATQDAARGAATQAEAFAALGVELRDSEGRIKSTETLLLDVADAFSQAEDNSAKATIAQRLFGESGAKLIPLLNQGRDGIESLKDEAAALGIVMDSEAAKAAERFNDNLTRVKTATEGVFVQLAESLLPTLERLSEQFVDAATDGDRLDGAVRGLDTAFRAAVTTGIVLYGVIRSAGQALGAFAAIAQTVGEAGVFDPTRGGLVGALVRPDDRARLAAVGGIVKDAYGDIVQSVSGDLEAISKLWDEQGAKVASSAEATGSRIKGALSLGGEGAGAPALQAQAQALQQLQSMVQAAQQQLDTFGEGEAAVLRYRLAHGDLADTLALSGAQGQAYAAQLVQLTEAMEARAQKAQQAAENEAYLAQLMQQGATLTESLRTPTEAYTATISRLNELIARGAIDQETYNRAVEQAQDSFDKAEKAGNVWAQQLESITDQAARNIQGVLADALEKPFEDGLDGMVKKFAAALQRMAAEAAAAQIFNALGSAVGGGGGGGIGDFLGGIFGGGRANGGPVSPGQVYEVGETGREWFVPDVPGQIVPDSKMAGTTIAPTIIVQAPEGRISKATEMQIGAAVTRSGLMASRRNN